MHTFALFHFCIHKHCLTLSLSHTHRSSEEILLCVAVMRFSHSRPYLPAQAGKGWAWVSEGWVFMCVNACVQYVCVWRWCWYGLIQPTSFLNDDILKSKYILLLLHHPDSDGSGGVVKRGWDPDMMSWNKKKHKDKKRNGFHLLPTRVFLWKGMSISITCLCWRGPGLHPSTVILDQDS